MNTSYLLQVYNIFCLHMRLMRGGALQRIFRIYIYIYIYIYMCVCVCVSYTKHLINANTSGFFHFSVHLPATMWYNIPRSSGIYLFIDGYSYSFEYTSFWIFNVIEINWPNKVINNNNMWSNSTNFSLYYQRLHSFILCRKWTQVYGWFCGCTFKEATNRPEYTIMLNKSLFIYNNSMSVILM